MVSSVAFCRPVDTPGRNNWGRDETGGDGDAGDQASDQAVGADGDVAEGGGDRQVAVDADGGEAEDGGGTEEHVGEHPRDATRGGGWDQLERGKLKKTVETDRTHLLEDGARHDNQGDEEVGDGECQQQDVRGLAKRSDKENAEDNEEVAEDGEADDDQHREGDQHVL